MDQLKAYIDQAHSQGYSDDQIRQSLITAGWAPDQINSALGSGQAAPPATVGTPAFSPVQPTVTASPQVSQQFNPNAQPNTEAFPNTVLSATPANTVQPKSGLLHSKFLIGAASLIVILVLISVAVIALGGSKISYQTTIANFISDIQRNNKAAADSLESPAFKSFLQKNASTTSFDTACQQSGVFCTAIFNTTYLSKGKLVYKDYTSSSGVKGKQAVYTVKQSSGGSQTSGGTSCNVSNSDTNLTIAVIPSGKKWLVDNVDENANASASACPVGGSSSTTITSN